MFEVDRDQVQSVPRVSLAKIDGVVSARLGTTRVAGNAQPAVFNRQIAMYLAKHVGGLEHHRDWQVLQRPGPLDSLLRPEASGGTPRDRPRGGRPSSGPGLTKSEASGRNR